MKKWLLSACILTHLLYINVVTFFPYPELFIYPYLASKGFLPYTQIFDQHFPTLLMLPVNFWTLGVTGEWQMRIVMALTIALTHVILFTISKKILGKSIISFIPNLLYLAFQPLYDGSFFWIDNLITPLVLLVLYTLFLSSKTLKMAIFSGLLLGVCVITKQTMILFYSAILFTLFIQKESRNKCIIVFVSSLFPIGALFYWIYSQGIWNEFFYWTFQFNYTIYPKLASQLPTFGQFLRFLLLWGATGYLYVRLKKKTVIHHVFVISALALTVPAFGRFEFLHLQTALPVVIILFSFIFLKSKFALPPFLAKRHIDFGILIFAFVLFMVLWHAVWFNKIKGVGSYFRSGDTSRISEEIKKRVEPGTHIFILGGNPVLYPLTNTLPAGEVYTVSVPWNYSVVQDTIIKGLSEDPPKLIVVDTNTSIDGQTEEDFAASTLKFINDNYEKTDTINGYDFHEKQNYEKQDENSN